MHSNDKSGADAGELVGIGRIGVTTTTEIDELIDLKPDCVAWLGQGWAPEAICQWLTAGVNVYVPLHAWYPDELPEYPDLHAACARGGSTLAAGGSIPGLISDVLPLFLSGYTGDIRQIRAKQSNLLTGYPSASQLRRGVGLGEAIPPAPDEGPNLTAVDHHWIDYIRQSARMVAHGVGIDFGDLTITDKTYVGAPEDIHLEASGLDIARGTVAGARWEFTATAVDGSVFYQLIKEQAAVIGLGPGWRQAVDEPQWQVEIDGTPSLSCALSTVDTDLGLGTTQLNAARAVNFLPAIAAAEPGCRSVFDLPLITGRC